MWGHCATLLLLGLLALQVEPSSANLKKKNRAEGVHHHQAGEIHMNEETLQTPTLLINESWTPGKCPSAITFHHLGASYCSEGGPCPGDQMCCRVGNILKCVLPEGVHRGYCPRSEDHPTAAASSSPCSHDSQCALDEKCCLRGGHRRCTKAQPEKRGLCPKRGILPVYRPCPSECKDDRCCSGGQKCCFKDCGLKCVDPEIHHHGSGQHDRQLWQQEKAQPVPGGHGGQGGVRPGKCPRPTGAGHCAELCSSDAVCPPGQKCCSNGCGHQCTRVTGDVNQAEDIRLDEETYQTSPPLTNVNPDECSDLAQSNEMLPVHFCSTNASCPGDQFCCSTMCGWQCVLPSRANSGYCPKEPPQSIQNVEQCSSDFSCNSVGHPTRKKCCTYGDLRTCVEAEEEHPGMCPKKKVLPSFAPCKDKCRDDRDCANSKKCCFSGCGLACLDPVPTDRCLLPPETGPCLASKLAYFYCSLRRKCLPFTYGGCRGNSNRFETKEECQKSCGKINTGVDEELLTEFASRSIPDFCNLRSDPGPCDNSTYRFYHSPHTGQCAVFVYRGCGGNRNNFETQLSCLQTCVDPDVCRLSPDQGHGDALRVRYYYSPTARTCKEFMYKSHGGNGNNFLTKANCLQFCAPRGGQ